MADTTEAVQGLDNFINGLAKSLGDSDPSANRVTSRTMTDGSSETYLSPGDQMHAMQKALDISSQLEARQASNNGIRFFKVTSN